MNGLLKVYLGVDLDTDILPWLGGDFALMADVDAQAFMEAMASNDIDMSQLPLDPRFAFVAETDGSEKPSAVVAAIGKLLTTQTKDMPGAPKFEIDSTEDATTIIIEDVAKGSGLQLNIQITGSGEFFVVGDQATVEEILSGEGGFADSAGFVEAQKYILPNASTIAYAGGEGWADLVTFGALVSRMSYSNSANGDAEAELIMDVLNSVYDILGSSSISASYNEDGSQNSRMVFSLK
jgi:hypothetical protein